MNTFKKHVSSKLHRPRVQKWPMEDEFVKESFSQPWKFGQRVGSKPLTSKSQFHLHLISVKGESNPSC